MIYFVIIICDIKLEFSYNGLKDYVSYPINVVFSQANRRETKQLFTTVETRGGSLGDNITKKS
ncbi:MAG: hypothetical protein RLZZ210_1618 [Pseudomonadota bacterium]|jgi:hypothetical protein